MFDGITPAGWLVILCALALGFGMVRFLIVTMNEKAAAENRAEDGATPNAPDDMASPPKEEDGARRPPS